MVSCPLGLVMKPLVVPAVAPVTPMSGGLHPPVRGVVEPGGRVRVGGDHIDVSVEASVVDDGRRAVEDRAGLVDDGGLDRVGGRLLRDHVHVGGGRVPELGAGCSEMSEARLMGTPVASREAAVVVISPASTMAEAVLPSPVAVVRPVPAKLGSSPKSRSLQVPVRLAGDSPMGVSTSKVGRCGSSISVLGLKIDVLLTDSGRKAAEVVPRNTRLPVRRLGNLIAVPKVLRIPISVADLASKSVMMPDKCVAAPVASRMEPRRTQCTCEEPTSIEGLFDRVVVVDLWLRHLFQ